MQWTCLVPGGWSGEELAMFSDLSEGWLVFSGVEDEVPGAPVDSVASMFPDLLPALMLIVGVNRTLEVYCCLGRRKNCELFFLINIGLMRTVSC